jgi:hypothetical protein
MMLNLIYACKNKILRVSSSHSVYSPPIARIVDGTKLYIAAGNIQCFVSEGAVKLQPELSATVINGSLVGDGGVWLSIASGDFWLEIHVPIPAQRQLQARPHGA